MSSIAWSTEPLDLNNSHIFTLLHFIVKNLVIEILPLKLPRVSKIRISPCSDPTAKTFPLLQGCSAMIGVPSKLYDTEFTFFSLSNKSTRKNRVKGFCIKRILQLNLDLRLRIKNKNLAYFPEPSTNENAVFVWGKGYRKNLQVLWRILQTDRNCVVSSTEDFVHSPDKDRPVTITTRHQ